MDHPGEMGEFRSLWCMTGGHLWAFGFVRKRFRAHWLSVAVCGARVVFLDAGLDMVLRHWGIFLAYLCPWITSFVSLCDLVLLRYPHPSSPALSLP